MRALFTPRLSATRTAVLLATGCTITRGRKSLAAPLDDSAITAAVKGRFAEDSSVDASGIEIDTLHGTVRLSGFARSPLESDSAESMTWTVTGVRQVNNQLAVRP